MAVPERGNVFQPEWVSTLRTSQVLPFLRTINCKCEAIVFGRKPGISGLGPVVALQAISLQRPLNAWRFVVRSLALRSLHARQILKPGSCSCRNAHRIHGAAVRRKIESLPIGQGRCLGDRNSRSCTIDKSITARFPSSPEKGIIQSAFNHLTVLPILAHFAEALLWSQQKTGMPRPK
jgi:hypothetical protein